MSTIYKTKFTFYYILFLIFTATIVVSCNYVSTGEDGEETEFYSIIDERTLQVDLTNLTELKQPGGSIIITDSRLPEDLVIAKVSPHKYSIVSSACPDLKSDLHYSTQSNGFKCDSKCKAEFDKDGYRQSGFSKHDLNSYSYTIIGNTMNISIN